jgi:hypothetical protein
MNADDSTGFCRTAGAGLFALDQQHPLTAQRLEVKRRRRADHAAADHYGIIGVRHRTPPLLTFHRDSAMSRRCHGFAARGRRVIDHPSPMNTKER